MGLVLERVEVSPQWPPAGGRLVVHMEWRGDPTALTGGEKIFLHLVDESGNLITQWDPEFRMESADHSIAAAMPIPSEVPDGSLRLLAGLYDVTCRRRSADPDGFGRGCSADCFLQIYGLRRLWSLTRVTDWQKVYEILVSLMTGVVASFCGSKRVRFDLAGQLDFFHCTRSQAL